MGTLKAGPYVTRITNMLLTSSFVYDDGPDEFYIQITTKLKFRLPVIKFIISFVVFFITEGRPYPGKPSGRAPVSSPRCHQLMTSFIALDQRTFIEQ